jgi:choline dehydrogenase-like flavoprotein
MDVFEHKRLVVCTGCEVRRFETAGGAIVAAVFQNGGREHMIRADLFALGANAIQSAAIMERSGLGGGLTGRGLHECYGHDFEVFLDGMDNFDGSTVTTGINYALYDGGHRGEAGGALVFFENRWRHGLRAQRGRLRQILPIQISVEELPDDDNAVSIDSDGKAVVHHSGPSDYALAGMRRAAEKLESVLAPLPVERVESRGERPTESHLQGTFRMGRDPALSVIDAGQVHHRFRNLVVVGSSVFPSSSSANPSLTVAALSLRAADLLTANARS